MKNTDVTPPPPEKPDPEECCGSGCTPCIFDYYYTRLAEWEEKYGAQKPDDTADANG